MIGLESLDLGARRLGVLWLGEIRSKGFGAGVVAAGLIIQPRSLLGTVTGRLHRIGGEAQPAHQFAGPHLEQLHGRHAAVGGQGQDIAGDGAIPQAHLLLGAEALEALQLVAHPGGGLEIEPLGVPLHLAGEQGQQFVIAPLEHHRHLAQDLLIVVAADLLLAHAGAAADVEVQAGAVAVERLGPLAQGEHPLDHGQGAAQLAHIHVGAIEAIVGFAETPLAGDKNARVAFTPSDAHIGIFFIILQQHIKVGLVMLDQVGFQRQRFVFAVGNDEFQVADLAHHQANAGAMAGGIVEITAHPLAQHLGLADIQNAVVAIAHQVATGFGRKLLEPRLEPLRVLHQGTRARAQVPGCWVPRRGRFFHPWEGGNLGPIQHRRRAQPP